MKMKVATITLDAVKTLDKIQKVDMPRAKAAAFNRAGRSGIAKARRNVAKGLRVPQKTIKKRFSLARASAKRPDIALYFRHYDFNPGLLNPRQTRKGVKARSHTFEGAFLWDDRSLVMTRKGKARLPIKKETIPLGRWAIQSAENTFRRVVPPIFAKRMEYEMERRIKRRVAR